MSNKWSEYLLPAVAVAAGGILSSYGLARISRAWGKGRQLKPAEMDLPTAHDLLVVGDGFDDDTVTQLVTRLRAQPWRTNLILHTWGGDVCSSARLAQAVKSHGNVHTWVPHRAMSGGTLIALASQEIHMWREACLGAVDPQVALGFCSAFSAHSFRHVVDMKGADVDELFGISEHSGRRALKDVTTLLSRFGVPQQAQPRLLNQDHSHSMPIFPDEAKEIGLKVSVVPSGFGLEDLKRLEQNNE